MVLAQKQKRRFIDTENKRVVAKVEGGGELGKISEED